MATIWLIEILSAARRSFRGKGMATTYFVLLVVGRS